MNRINSVHTDPDILGQGTQTSESIIIAIPGLRHPVRVICPSDILRKCTLCEKYFKTRDVCRVVEAHTYVPSKKHMHLCITIDKSCLNTFNTLPQTLFYIAKPTSSSSELKKTHICSTINPPNISGNKRTRRTYEYAAINPSTNSQIACTACYASNHSRKACRTKRNHLGVPHTSVYLTLFVATDEERHALQQECLERLQNSKAAYNVVRGEEKVYDIAVQSIQTCKDDHTRIFESTNRSDTFLMTLMPSSDAHSSVEVRRRRAITMRCVCVLYACIVRLSLYHPVLLILPALYLLSLCQ